MRRALRQQGLRTYRSHIHANVGCTLDAAAQMEMRLESIAQRRGSRVRIVGHSLGGMLARGVAVTPSRPRRPASSRMGSPMLAPGAHHVACSASVDDAGAAEPGRRARPDVGGLRGRRVRPAELRRGRAPLAGRVDFTAIYSRRDGIVDWRACIDPLARAVEVRASHLGMAFDPRVIDRRRRRRCGPGRAQLSKSIAAEIA